MIREKIASKKYSMIYAVLKDLLPNLLIEALVGMRFIMCSKLDIIDIHDLT